MEIESTPNQHFYNVILTSADPQKEQPEKITIPLKPHQLVALQKAYTMEQNEFVSYYVPTPREEIPYSYCQNPNIFGYFQLKTNIGIIGDVVGYGKTLIGLSIIASLQNNDIHIQDFKKYSFNSFNGTGYMEITKENTQRSFVDKLIHTTLVVVPRGPVYMHWLNSINKNTKLKVVAIDNLVYIKKFLPNKISALKEYLEKYDVVLIKNTTLTTLIEHYSREDATSQIYGFDRVMIDEAHTIIVKIPDFSYKFLWLITSSYKELFFYNYSKTMYSGVLEVFQNNIERLHYALIKGDSDFVRSSFNVPRPIERYYICKMANNLSAIQPFLTNSIQDKINVNDISGAIKELGGSTETENDLINLVIADLDKSISNAEKEISFIMTLDLEPQTKEARLKSINNDLQRYTIRKTSIETRLKEVVTNTCSICYDTLENPIYLNCTHTFCGQCIFTWMQTNMKTRGAQIQCPECRTVIDSTKIVAIVKEKAKEEEGTLTTILTKEDRLLDIILQKPEGRFLVFSRMDTTFGRLSNMLSANAISHTELKGATSCMMKILKDFQDNKIKVILLNTYHAGCGIDISNATDVIIYHSMPQEKVQAVGRAQRVGRTEALTIHNLCYAHEN